MTNMKKLELKKKLINRNYILNKQKKPLTFNNLSINIELLNNYPLWCNQE